MADEADAGNEMAAKLQEAYLAVRKPNGPEATGFCLSCGEEVKGSKRWCDADCHTDYTRALNSKRRKGVV